MKTRAALQALARVVADEAESNQAFDAKLRQVLQLDGGGVNPRRTGSHRRSPALLDPVEVVRASESELRQKLGELSVEQLKDIVAQYAMDPSRLVMKWKKRERIVDHIMSVSVQRAAKGDVFRTSPIVR